MATQLITRKPSFIMPALPAVQRFTQPKQVELNGYHQNTAWRNN